MRKRIIAGNWKMNGTKATVQALLNELKQNSKNLTNITWIVFPPYPFLDITANILQNTNISWGGQNLSEKPSGAYTGEVSANMLNEFGCKYVLIGHSERRQYYNETDQLVFTKADLALKTDLTPIICIGETLDDRKQTRTFSVIDQQLKLFLESSDGLDILAKSILAYEPVWAIGTGLTANPEQAEEVHKYIRSKIANHTKNVAENLAILYGGSLKPDNAKALFTQPNVDGGLIGGASLVAKDFIKIGESCYNY